jgi:hypothetical protein
MIRVGWPVRLSMTSKWAIAPAWSIQWFRPARLRTGVPLTPAMMSPASSPCVAAVVPGKS